MTNRVTHRTIQESTLAHLQGNLSAMSRLQEQLSTGKRINRPSDDPTGTISALQLRQQLRSTDQHARNAGDGLAWLGAADTALQTTSTQLRRARDLVVRALNTGASSSESQAAVAVELDGIRSAVQGLANTQYLGRNVFAGTSGWNTAVIAPGETDPSTGLPVTEYTWAPTGDGTVDRQVGPTSTVTVDTRGADVFGDGAGSVFALLADITAKVSSGTLTGDDLTALDERMGSVLTGLADVGARYNRVQQAQDAAADAKVALTGQLSDAEDVDLPSTIVNLQMQQTAYQAALGATAKVLQPSLMDFLK